MRWIGSIVPWGKIQNSCKCLSGKLVGKGKLRRPESRWEYNIRMGLKEILLLTPFSTVLLEKLTGSQPVKKFPAFYGTLKVHYRIHKCPPSVRIPSQIDPVHTPTSYFLKIHTKSLVPFPFLRSYQSISPGQRFFL